MASDIHLITLVFLFAKMSKGISKYWGALIDNAEIICNTYPELHKKPKELQCFVGKEA